MNLVIDCGNTRIKVAMFENKTLKEKLIFENETELFTFLGDQKIEHTLVSSVSLPPENILSKIRATGRKIKLTYELPLPIKNNYATPQTLGVDRIAGVCGALDIYPNQNCLVIDIGTCINYEFLDKNACYQGGAISPGITIRYEGMHKFTQQLPLITNKPNVPLIGNSTESCMQSGVMNGMIAEISGIIELYKKNYSNLRVILCGGDYSLFENQLKHHIFVAPELVLIGLNRILLHNVQL